MADKPNRAATQDRWEEIKDSQSIFKTYPRSFWVKTLAVGLAALLVLLAIFFVLYLLQGAWWDKVIT